MEIATLIIISILSCGVGYAIGAKLTHVRKSPSQAIRNIQIRTNDIERHKISVMIDKTYFSDNMINHAVIHHIMEKIGKKLDNNIDMFINKEQINDNGMTRYTFEFYTKNK